MSSLPTAIILKELDCLTMRATVSAQNIANAGTPGYRPVYVAFEGALSRAAAEGPAAVAALQPRLEPEAVGEGGMRLDMEVARASQTAMRYEALIEMLGQRLQDSSVPLAEG